MILNRKWLLPLIMISNIVFSQKKEQVKKDEKLDEVIVTATRTKRQLSLVPMPVTLITKKQLQKSGSVRLRDILLEQTGIVMVTDFGNSEGLQLQGVSADYTLIMIDGVPIVGRTSGNIDLNRLTVNSIKQIEVVKGPSSSLYGSEAIGGVVNIITETPKENQLKGNFQLLTRFGAKNELDINAGITSKKDKLGVVADVNLNSSGGFDLSPETENITTYPHQNFTGNLKVLYDFSENLKGNISQRLYTQNQKSAFGNNTQRDWNFSTNWNHRINNSWSIDYSFYGTQYKAESVFNNEVTVFDRSLNRPEIKSKLKLKNSNLITGVGVNFDALLRSEFDDKKKFIAYYAFAQYDFNPLNRLNVVLGARFDNPDKYKSAFSPKLSARYKINNWLAVKTSVGTGFKAPDFRQLYLNFRNGVGGYIVLGTQAIHDLYPNATGLERIERELKPETSIGYNFGFQIKPINNLKLDINLFRNDISELIDTFDTELNPNELNLPNNTRVFSYRNISEVYTQGVELDVSYKLNHNLKILGGYQFLDTGDKEQESKIKNGEIFIRRTSSSSSEKLTLNNYFGLANRSKHTANLKLFYENFEHNFSANIRGIYRSKYALFDTNNSQGIIDNYDKFVSDNLQINLTIDKSFKDFITLQVGVDNLFNEEGVENSNNFPNNDSVLRLGRIIYSRIQFNF
ncbi:TonB-dependent receptor [Tenacibaculum sp. S7007]|uniref:TonB-dependent receptor n=1 Tax=Tenacibaculum pelagium TaxID=2759527 RepID=A0A839AJX3_9FLAO|nr:TonB-dependent receptor [Tenacibaculum pelagium]MBA6155442.1 TonB-dependent receptor [Tenacibaculum pelagium]